ncbi:MAG TPA: hypothetical protein VIP28_00250 [Nocardioides sp.]
MTVLNYTTKIAATKTVGEIQAMLAKAGASRIATDYEDGGASGLTFSLTTPHGPKLFSLPVDVRAMHRLLVSECNDGKLRSGGVSIAVLTSREHAERVAWRVMKDWLEAQLALVQTQMVQIDQVLLPYLHVDGDTTLYAAYRERESALAIEGGASRG